MGSSILLAIILLYFALLLGIAFYIFGNWSLSQVLAVGIINYIYKATSAVVLTPLLYIAHYFIDKYLGKEHAEDLANESAMSSFM